MVGRTLAMLAQVAPEFAAETTTSGWRLAGRATDSRSRAMRRAEAWLSQDIEAAHEGYEGAAAVKFALAGPWTVAASVDLPNGHRILSDPGAVRDLSTAFSHVCAEQVSRLARLWPEIVLQIDEPHLPNVLGARVSTPSGMDRYRAVGGESARAVLAAAIDVVHAQDSRVVLHCCAIPAPIPLLRATGADALSLDLLQQSAAGTAGNDEEALGELLESGGGLIAGVVPVFDEPLPSAVHRPLALLGRLGIALDDVLRQLTISTACGLAGATPAQAREAMVRVAAVAATLAAEVA